MIHFQLHGSPMFSTAQHKMFINIEVYYLCYIKSPILYTLVKKNHLNHPLKHSEWFVHDEHHSLQGTLINLQGYEANKSPLP